MGKVIVQSYTPDNFALVTAANHDYQGFFDMEIQARRFMDYPPFTDLILVEFTSEKEEEALETGGGLQGLSAVPGTAEGEGKHFFAEAVISFQGQGQLPLLHFDQMPEGSAQPVRVLHQAVWRGPDGRQARLQYDHRCKSIQYILEEEREI